MTYFLILVYGSYTKANVQHHIGGKREGKEGRVFVHVTMHPFPTPLAGIKVDQDGAKRALDIQFATKAVIKC